MLEQGTRFYSAQELLRMLNVPRHRLDYLFNSRRIKAEDFTVIGGQRLYSSGDVERIKQALFEVGNR